MNIFKIEEIQNKINFLITELSKPTSTEKENLRIICKEFIENLIVYLNVSKNPELNIYSLDEECICISAWLDCVEVNAELFSFEKEPEVELIVRATQGRHIENEFKEGYFKSINRKQFKELFDFISIEINKHIGD
jgi:hypothetical protein